jgi:hypothetical protein
LKNRQFTQQTPPQLRISSVCTSISSGILNEYLDETSESNAKGYESSDSIWKEWWVIIGLVVGVLIILSGLVCLARKFRTQLKRIANEQTGFELQVDKDSSII